jgi:hypothetical protein
MKERNVVLEMIVVAIGLISIGASLVVYAHANFASKSTVEKMDDRIYDLWRTLPPEKRTAPED